MTENAHDVRNTCLSNLVGGAFGHFHPHQLSQIEWLAHGGEQLKGSSCGNNKGGTAFTLMA
jgi:hypothetical protein